MSTKAIDVHAHLIPQAMWAALDRGERWYGASLVQEGGVSSILNAERKASPVEANWRFLPEERVRDMDSKGVSTQVLSVAPWLTNYHLDPALALRSSRDINEEIAEWCRDRPQRFVGLATVPAQDPALAARELDRALGSLGLKGVTLGTNVMGRNWDDPSLAPILQACNEAGAFVFFHPLLPVAGGDRLGRYYLSNSIGFILDTTICIASLIFGGVLDRLPDLKLCFAHGGGYACYGIARIEHTVKWRPETKAIALRKLPEEYLRGLYFDHIVHSYRNLKFLLDLVGPSQVVLGSDYPFDMGFTDPVGWLRGAPISQRAKDGIVGRNLTKVLGV
ncbi:MAG: amidohydrolase [Chloroflexi bacterium]|nr:amidohydrolase [Chloroflexota bacterium]